MEYKCFDVSVDDQVAHIVLSRPEKRNSMVPEFWDELPEIVREIDEKSMARAIVISSTGPHFSAGLDLQAFAPSENLGGLAGDAAEKSKRQSGARFYNNVMHMQHVVQ